MNARPTIIAADLVPWWFAAAFWVALLALLVIVVRDVRRAGGLRPLVAAIRQAFDDRFGPDADDDRPT